MTTEQRLMLEHLTNSSALGPDDVNAIDSALAELDEYRRAVAVWAEKCRWGAENWKREPYNAELFALARRDREA